MVKDENICKSISLQLFSSFTFFHFILFFFSAEIPEPVAEAQNGVQENFAEPQYNPELPNDNDSNTTTPQEPAQNIPPQPSALRILCTFFVSFVTSLIPNPPAIPQQ